MNIKEKIEFIRQQPDNVRMRYVWICVATCMLVVFAIWIFSITMTFKKNVSPEKSIDTTELQQQLQNIKDQSSSLKDYVNQPLNIGDEGVSGDSQPPTTDGNSEIPETNTPSNLPSNGTSTESKGDTNSQEKLNNYPPSATDGNSEIPEKRMPPDLPKTGAGDRQ